MKPSWAAGRKRYGSTVFRNRSNYFWGHFVAYGMFGVVVAPDPLGLYSVWVDGGQGLASMGWYLLYFFLISFGAYRIFARPCVRIGFSEVVVVNPISACTFDAAGVSADSIVAGIFYPSLNSDHGNIPLVGMEVSLLGEALGSRGLRKLQESFPPKGGEANSNRPAKLLDKSYRMDQGSAILLFLWSAYVILGMMFGK